jgi:sugar phosphate isomerase/epimerase
MPRNSHVAHCATIRFEVITMSATQELSVQLYAVRDSLTADFDGTLERLAGLGFRQVEPFRMIDFAEQLRTGLSRHGLSAPTTHQQLIGADLDAVFAAASGLGIGTVIVPSADPARWQTESGVIELAEEMSEIGAAATPHGVRVGYHNHHFELESKIDGRHALEVFADELAPEVVLEVDTYWAYAGGADVPALLRRLGGRVTALHIKDGDGTLDTSAQVAVGSGSIPVRDILAAAPHALRVVELDDTTGDMFSAIEASRAYLISSDPV